jgi:hypothetical protein
MRRLIAIGLVALASVGCGQSAGEKARDDLSHATLDLKCSQWYEQYTRVGYPSPEEMERRGCVVDDDGAHAP